jgi:hypothetical protein
MYNLRSGSTSMVSSPTHGGGHHGVATSPAHANATLRRRIIELEHEVSELRAERSAVVRSTRSPALAPQQPPLLQPPRLLHLQSTTTPPGHADSTQKASPLSGAMSPQHSSNGAIKPSNRSKSPDAAPNVAVKPSAAPAGSGVKSDPLHAARTNLTDSPPFLHETATIDTGAADALDRGMTPPSDSVELPQSASLAAASTTARPVPRPPPSLSQPEQSLMTSPGGSTESLMPTAGSFDYRLKVRGTIMDSDTTTYPAKILEKHSAIVKESGAWPQVPVTWYEVNTESTEAGFTSHAVTVRIAPEPFGNGAFRTVHYMLLPRGRHHHELFVIKCATESAKAPPPIAQHNCFADVRMQTEAGRLAALYNAVKPPKEVHFLPSAAVHFAQPAMMPDALKRFAEQQYAAVEPLVLGEYIKWSNNLDYLSPMGHMTPLAFSHFTYEASSGECLVCDIQGVQSGRGGGYIFTDPQIHGTIRRWGKGDLGREGIRLFFSAHKCNDVCKMLKLTPSNSTNAEDPLTHSETGLELVRTQTTHVNTLSTSANSPLVSQKSPSSRARNVALISAMQDVMRANQGEHGSDGAFSTTRRRRLPLHDNERLVHEVWLDVADVAERAREGYYSDYLATGGHDAMDDTEPRAGAGDGSGLSNEDDDPVRQVLMDFGGLRVHKRSRFLWGKNALVTVGHHVVRLSSTLRHSSPGLAAALASFNDVRAPSRPSSGARSPALSTSRFMVEADLPEFDDNAPMRELREIDSSAPFGRDDSIAIALAREEYVLVRQGSNADKSPLPRFTHVRSQSGTMEDIVGADRLEELFDNKTYDRIIAVTALHRSKPNESTTQRMLCLLVCGRCLHPDTDPDFTSHLYLHVVQLQRAADESAPASADNTQPPSRTSSGASATALKKTTVHSAAVVQRLSQPRTPLNTGSRVAAGKSGASTFPTVGSKKGYRR